MDLKRGADGKPVQKNPRKAPGAANQIAHRLSSQLATQAVEPNTKRKAKRKKTIFKAGQKRKNTVNKKIQKQLLKDTARDCDLIVELENDCTVLNLGQLLLQDAIEAKKQMDRLLTAEGREFQCLARRKQHAKQSAWSWRR